MAARQQPGTEEPRHVDPVASIDQTRCEHAQSRREARDLWQEQQRRVAVVAGVTDRMREPTGCERKLLESLERGALDSHGRRPTLVEGGKRWRLSPPAARKDTLGAAGDQRRCRRIGGVSVVHVS